jgi:multiple antibiotic resistance protein
MIGPGEIFTIFFVTLGPLKILGPFAHRTRGLDEAVVRRIAVRAFLIATVALVAGAFVGRSLAAKWHVTLPALLIAAGIVFFVVALRQLLEQYEPSDAGASTSLPDEPTAAAIHLLFPIVLTPYGIAAAIVILAASGEAQRTEMIVALLIAVMLLDLVAMLFARRILVGIIMVVLQVLGAVLGVMQLGLATQFVLSGLQRLGVIAG